MGGSVRRVVCYECVIVKFGKLSATACLLLTLLPVRADDVEDQQTSDDSPYDDIEVLAQAIQLIRQEYVDENSADYRKLIYSALRGMLEELDPHSQFMAPSDYEGMQEDAKGEFGGLGLSVDVLNGILTVSTPMEDGPAWEAGILPDDQILKINKLSTDQMTIPEIIELLRGEPGDKVTLTIRRPATDEVRDYELTRQIIKFPTIKDPHVIDPRKTGGHKIGYVRIRMFNDPTAEELEEALAELDEQEIEALVLDLRYNPGGLLTSAVDVASLFLPPGSKVVSTEGRGGSNRGPYYTTARVGEQRTYPVAVLINTRSASGSEIVAGALKDLGRAILVGETTFGKGSVQSVIALQDGSALRLTTAKYYTPSRNLIHEHGVEPNIRSALTYEEEAKLLTERRNAERAGQPFDEVEDIQLERALDVLTGTLIFEDRTKAPKPASASAEAKRNQS